MRRYLIIGLCIIVTVLISESAGNAYVVNTDGEYVTDIQSLEVEGYGIFNIDFIWDSYSDIFGTEFDFDTQAGAEAVSDQINSAINSEGSLLIKLDTNSSTFSYLIPYSFNSEDSVNILNNVKNNNVWDSSGLATRDIDLVRAYAVATSVPIPGAFWLLGSGLIGIVGIRRKLKK